MPLRRRQTRRKQRQQRRTQRRRQRGGRLPPLMHGVIKWPPRGGCAGNPIPVTLEIDDLFDRFGPESGTYISPVGATAARIAKTLGIAEEQPNLYSYTNRALPYAGVTGGGVEGNVLRDTTYRKIYRKNLAANTSDYHLYRVTANDAVNGMACIVAPAFNTAGGGVQINLKKPVGQYVGMQAIEEKPLERIPAYKHGGAPIEKTTNTDALTMPEWQEWMERPEEDGEKNMNISMEE
jgi:hypothetical protein